MRNINQSIPLGMIACLSWVILYYLDPKNTWEVYIREHTSKLARQSSMQVSKANLYMCALMNNIVGFRKFKEILSRIWLKSSMNYLKSSLMRGHSCPAKCTCHQITAPDAVITSFPKAGKIRDK